jgi:subtilisin family serine protease
MNKTKFNFSNYFIAPLVIFSLLFFFSCESEQYDEKPLANNEQIEFIEVNIEQDDLVDRKALRDRFVELYQLHKDASFNMLTDIELASAFSIAQTDAVSIFWSEESESDFEKDIIIQALKLLEPEPYTDRHRQILEVNTDYNYINARIRDINTLIKIRNLEEVEGIDVYFNMFSDEETDKIYEEIKNRIENSNNPVNLDYSKSLIQNQTLDPYVGNNQGVHQFWNASDISGDNVKVAVVDVGVDPNNDVFKAGGTYNSTHPNSAPFQQYGFWRSCEWCFWQSFQGPYSQSSPLEAYVFRTHGVDRLLEIGESFYDIQDNNEAGIAYDADLVSYRASRSVVLDISSTIFSNIMGTARSYQHIANSDVDIVSMSMGAAFSYNVITRAVKKCHDNDKLIFNAAGTLPFGIALESFLFDTFGVFTVFPARLDTTVACTGVVVSPTNELSFHWATFGNSDFVVGFDSCDFCIGSSSQATAYTAAMAAIIKSNETNLSSDGIFNRLAQIADDPSGNIQFFGHGRVHLDNYLNIIGD